MTTGPTSVPEGETISQAGAIAEVLVFAVFLALGAVMVWALLRAAQHPAPMALVVALSLLSLAAIGGFIATESGDLITLAATGFGALAGAVSSQFHMTTKEADHDPAD